MVHNACSVYMALPSPSDDDGPVRRRNRGARCRR
jgi:hypothetical protein